MKELKHIVFLMATIVVFAGCSSSSDIGGQQYEVFENHNISACGIKDPLKNIEWLKKYCISLNETQNFSSVYIYIYKVINTNEHIFKIGISYSDFDNSPFLYSEYWRDCIGEPVFSIHSGVPAMPELVEEFLKDKEYIAELYHLVKR